MRRTILAGNWKMNMGLESVEAYFHELTAKMLPSVGEVTRQMDVMLAVPFTLLVKCQQLAKGTGIQIAAQNAHWEKKGAFTGEISLPMIKELGPRICVIGHSERRQYFNETDATIALKLQSCFAHDVRPILCIGETLLEREQGQAREIVIQQLASALEKLTEPRDLIIAYEPVWAIGTGLAATAEQAQEVHDWIRQWLTSRFGEDLSQRLPILYGGSMNAANTEELLRQPDIDGGLVGGASLKPAEFSEMIATAFKIGEE